jgi:hypothetical protein
METSSNRKDRAGLRHAFAISLIVLAAAFVAQAQDIAGDWQGTLSTGGGELRIVLHITKSPEGALKAILDSPDQAIAGMTVDAITLDGAKLKFTVNVVKGSYEGTVKNAGSISGNWSQPQKMPLDFKKTASPLKTEHKPAAPSDIDGTWSGTIVSPDGKLNVVFHLKNMEDGLTATMDSPDQHVTGWPATTVARKSSSIKIEMKQVGGLYMGKINKNLDTISGDWTQGAENVPLLLKREKEAPSNPQK